MVAGATLGRAAALIAQNSFDVAIDLIALADRYGRELFSVVMQDDSARESVTSIMRSIAERSTRGASS